MSAADDLLGSDTMETLAVGRQAATDLWVAARSKLRRLFIVFVVGLLGTIYLMRVLIWPVLERDLLARGASVVAITPFDVILLQAKIGIVIGILLALPLFLYYARQPLKERGLYPEGGIAPWKLLGLFVVAVGLFSLGGLYSYEIFFPILFNFLASNALSAGLSPTYSIVDWTQFILMLGLSFGIAAETPLAMGSLTYYDVVPYRTFRSYWKHTVVVIFILGALLTPPDVFTQLMMATPLLVLFAVSLGVSKTVSRFSPRRRRRRALRGPAPEVLDLAELDEAGVRAAPREAFTALSEDQAVDLAGRAIDDGRPDAAKAILARWDEEGGEGGERGEGGDDAVGEATGAADATADTGRSLQDRTAGFLSVLAEEETSQDDIGGYFYDIAFVFDSIRSKGFLLFGLFLAVVISVFTFLYTGGIGRIRNDFIKRLPAAVHPQDIHIVTLHPVEALVFEVKLAVLLGLVTVLPALLYLVWPPLQERGLVRGDRNVFFGWAGALILGLLAGSAFGYLVVAPAVVSYLVWDALQAHLIIAYRVSNFFWLVFFTTVGIGIMLDIPVTMVLFQRAGIVSYRTMRKQWRIVVLGTMFLAAALTPASVLSMVLVAIPVTAFYLLGLLVLWVVTLGGRRDGPRGAQPTGD